MNVSKGESSPKQWKNFAFSISNRLLHSIILSIRWLDSLSTHGQLSVDYTTRNFWQRIE